MDPGSVGPSHHGSPRQMLPLLLFQRSVWQPRRPCFFNFMRISLLAVWQHYPPNKLMSVFFFFFKDLRIQRKKSIFSRAKLN